MTLGQHRIVLPLFFVLGVLATALGLMSLKWIGTARADTGSAIATELVDAGTLATPTDGGPYRPLFVDAGLDGSATAAAPTAAEPPDTGDLARDFAELQAAYKALRGSTDKDAKLLLWAAALAAGLRLLLTGVGMVASKWPKKYLAWTALGLAVPIALLSHYAGGHGWFDSLIFAGAGPGAIVVNELLKLFRKE